MSLFNSQTIEQTDVQAPLVLQYTTEAVEVPYEEAEGKTVQELFEEYAFELGIPNQSVEKASFRSLDGPLNTTSVIEPGMSITASISHDSKGV